MVIRSWNVRMRSVLVSIKKISSFDSHNRWHGRGLSAGGARHYTAPTNVQTTARNNPSHTETIHVPHTTDAAQGLPVIPERNLPTKREGHEGSIPLGHGERGRGRDHHAGGKGRTSTDPSVRILDAITTTAIGIGAVFVGGFIYIKWYKKNVLDKMEAAFLTGYDPMVVLKSGRTKNKLPENEQAPASEPVLSLNDPQTTTLRRREQDILDHIVHGNESSHYYLVLGPKGSGKGAMISDAISSCKAEGVSVCFAHPDLEVFRIRLGKALNYEFNEDTQLGLFQRREPREAGPSLDIERALNKLEEVAIRTSSIRGKPLVFVVNNIHMFQNDTEGRNILLQLQEKAEDWAASGILTVVFSSDDFWPFHLMRKNANHMRVLSVNCVPQNEPSYTASRIQRYPRVEDVLNNGGEDHGEVFLVGGRQYRLDKEAQSKGTTFIADYMIQVEKQWLLSQIGLVPDCDDDVIDDQKWSSRSWLLLQEFVKLHEERLAAGSATGLQKGDDIPLPSIPYWKCRQIMTRPDFIEELDRLNIIAIDTHYNVRPDSSLILQAAQEVVHDEGFEQLLQSVRTRIDEIESLQRTRELMLKDLSKGSSSTTTATTDKRFDDYHDTPDDKPTS